MPDYDTDDKPPSTAAAPRDDEVIELEAVEIPRQRPSVHDIDQDAPRSYSRQDGGSYEETYSQRQRIPTFVFGSSPNIGCNCCLFWIVAFILSLFAIF